MDGQLAIDVVETSEVVGSRRIRIGDQLLRRPLVDVLHAGDSARPRLLGRGDEDAERVVAVGENHRRRVRGNDDVPLGGDVADGIANECAQVLVARAFSRDTTSGPSLRSGIRSAGHRLGLKRLADPPHERLAPLDLSDNPRIELRPLGCPLDDLLVEIAETESLGDPTGDRFTIVCVSHLTGAEGEAVAREM